MELPVRLGKVLRSIVESYISTVEPVSSKAVSATSNLRLSPASIRNVMARLEELHLITQPHTSAGRVPTDKGFRFYVDTLLFPTPLSAQDRRNIQAGLRNIKGEAEAVLRDTAKVLSGATGQIALVFTPRRGEMTVKVIHFIRVNATQVLAVCVSGSGLVEQRLVNEPEDMTQDELNQASRYLNDLLAGLTFRQVREKIARELEDARMRYNKLERRALLMSREALDESDYAPEKSLHIEGASRLAEQPEFSDHEKLIKLFGVMEEKKKLLHLLDNTLDTEEMRIYIGAENKIVELGECSFVLTTYKLGDYPIGAIGVMGPMRMDYSRIIPLVNYTVDGLKTCLPAV